MTSGFEAEQYAKIHRLQRGLIHIARELRLRGVAKPLIVSGIEKLQESTDFVDCAFRLLSKRAWRYQIAGYVNFTEVIKAKHRAWGFLDHAGYETETIEVVLERVGWFTRG